MAGATGPGATADPGEATTAGATFGGAAGRAASECGAGARAGEVGTTWLVIDAGGPGRCANTRMSVLGPSIHGRPAANVTRSMRSERLPPAA
jgi:hypothetical protein